MAGIGGGDFQGSEEEGIIMSSSGILYSSNLKYPDGDLRKNGFQDLAVDLNPYNNHHHHHHHHHQQQQQLQGSGNNSGLARLRSAPSSFFGDLVNGGVGGGFDDFRYFRPSSPDMDAIFSRLLSPTSNGNPDHLLIPSPAAPELQGFVKQEAMDSSFQHESSGEWKDHGGDSAPTFMDSIHLGSTVASAAAAAANSNNSNHGANLARHNSSPAGLFSSLVVENGFHGIGEVGPSPRISNSNSNSTSSRLTSSRTTSFSTTAPRLLPQISEIGEETFKTPNSAKRLPSNDSWDFASLDANKRLKQDNDGDDLDFFSTLNAMDNLQHQNGSSGGNRLTHHLSLPKTAAEMASVEKFLQLQGSVPCKIRAKRGFATHPRSIAERVRRTKISERMRKLQDLFPKTDKTNTAEMLDLAVEYIKDLQKQVKSMKDTKASCTCLREQKA